MAVNGSRVDITFHKETPHEEWETLGSFLPNHGLLTTKNARGVCVLGREGGREGGRERGSEPQGEGRLTLLVMT